MKTLILISALVLLAISPILSQNTDSLSKPDTVKYWDKGGFMAVNFNQVSLTNWAQGGESSISGSSLINLFANYKNGAHSWDNILDLGYGFIKSEDIDVRKNEDKLELSSKYGYKAFDHVFYSALMSFKTQFQPGYNYPDDSTVISRFLSPAYLIASLGFDYKPDDNFSFYLSPATGRFIIIEDQAIADMGLYGNTGAVIDPVTKKIITPGETFRTDFGAFARAAYKSDIWENVGLESKLELFDNYTDKNPDNRANIDVNWENKLIMKVNKYLAVNLYVLLVYDHDVRVPLYEKINGIKTKTGEGIRLQVKEVAGIGFSVKL